MNRMLQAAPGDAGKRLDWFLHEQLPEYSRSRLQGWIKEDRVLLDGGTARASYVLRGGERVEVSPGELTPLKATPEDLPLSVLYEDEDVIVIDKPAGMVVHAGAGHHQGTLVNALLHHFGQLSSAGGGERPGIVHRLDKETSGVIVVARTDRAHQALAEQFHRREIEKIYLALVQGVTPERRTILDPITRDPVHRTRMTARLGTGRKAITHFETLERLDPFSYLQVSIGTGRTHQIRVHLAAIGHPIVGDTLYGAARQQKGLPPLGRFFLHAASLRFRSPTTGESIHVESRLAPELENWLDLARVHASTLTKHNRGS